MARTKDTPLAPATMPEILPAKARALVAAQDELAVIEQQRQHNLLVLAGQLGYKGSLGSDVLMDGARASKVRLGMAMMEFGAYLLLLKEGCGHGEFGNVLAKLEIVPRTASTYMAITRRLANRPTSAVLAGLEHSKAVELLGLDDDQLDELADAGATGPLALDDVARMSVRELRAAVRDAKAEKIADDKLLATKDAKINKLSRHIAKATPDEVLLELQKEAAAITHDAMGCVRGQMRQALLKLRDHCDHGDQYGVFMAGLVGQIQADLSALREEFNLPDVSNAADQQLLAEMEQWSKPAK